MKPLGESDLLLDESDNVLFRLKLPVKDMTADQRLDVQK